MDNYKQDSLSSLGLQIDDEVKQELMETAKWTKFISIVIFCFSAVMLLSSIFGASTLFNTLRSLRQLDEKLDMMTSIGGGVVVGIIAVVFILITLTYYFMFRFSTKIKIGIAIENVENVNEAFSSLKIFFIITTIFGILTLLGTIINLIKF